jgi:predicted small lipoprotein YifL
MLTTLRSHIMPLTVVVALGLVLAGCGRKGNLEVPGAKPVAKADSNLGSDSTSTTKPKPKVEDQPFILDPIL